MRQRFFEEDERAFARSLQFRVRPQDMPRLKALYEEHVWKTLSELDEAARHDPEAIPMGTTLCWAPLELTLKTLEREQEEEEDATH